ncbi:MAG: DUF5110 domain-containing protein, partial [Acidobacteriota bacterium]|nr:DUF5110 domain-containing protein [Acidobacteriota bacterium]
RLYLPAGAWYDFWTGERLAGGREIERTVDLATIPLYVRAGAILPMGPVKQYTAEPGEAPLELTVYPGADGAFSLYEDDGISFDFRNGAFQRVHVAWDDRRRRLNLRTPPGARPPQAPRRFSVGIAGAPRKREIVFHGRPLSLVL